MSTTRVFYQVLNLYNSPTPATGFMFTTGSNNAFTGQNSGFNLIQQFQRIQTVSDSFNISRTDINQLGQLAAVSREIINAPTVSLEGSYYLADFSNERKLGLYVSGNQSALTNLLNKTQDEKNYFIAVAPQGQDQIGWTGQSQVFQITNGFLSSYSAEGAVGGVPTANFTIQGLNWATSTGSVNQVLQAVDQSNGQVVANRLFSLPIGVSGLSNTVSALRPADITVSIGNASIGMIASDIKLQSFNVSFDLNRQDLQRLGTRFAYSKEIQFPVTCSASISAYYGDLTTGALSDMLCNDVPYNITIQLADPTCTGGGNVACEYKLLGMKIDSQSFAAQGVGDLASTVTINYSTQLGGPNSTIGLYLSGRNI
jgi:hypothetical protein